MRVRSPFRSLPQDDPPIESVSYEGEKSQSVEWVFAHLHLDLQEEDPYDEAEVRGGVERRRPWLYRAAVAAVVVVALGAGGLFTLSQMKGRSAGQGSGSDRALAAAQTAPPVSHSASLPPLSLPSLSPGTAAPGTTVSATASVAAPATLPKAAGLTEAALTLPSGPAQQTDAAPLPPVSTTPEPTTGPAVVAPPPLAAIAPEALVTPVGGPFAVRLNYTADQSERAAAFAHQLRREGLKVTSVVVPASHGRWPGVAFFFNSDRERAKLIARQLASVTGLKEHARLSPRHPYPKPGIVEVSLLRTAGSGGRTSEKRAHTHRLP